MNRGQGGLKGGLRSHSRRPDEQSLLVEWVEDGREANHPSLHHKGNLQETQPFPLKYRPQVAPEPLSCLLRTPKLE